MVETTSAFLSFRSSRRYGSPSTISFVLAGGLSADNVQETGISVVASRGTAPGVTVSCIGDSGSEAEMNALAAEIANSLSAQG
jgi:hypothetical protein